MLQTEVTPTHKTNFYTGLNVSLEQELDVLCRSH